MVVCHSDTHTHTLALVPIRTASGWHNCGIQRAYAMQYYAVARFKIAYNRRKYTLIDCYC